MHARLTACVVVGVLLSATAMAVDTAPVAKQADPVVDYVNDLEAEADAQAHKSGAKKADDAPLTDAELAAMYEQMAGELDYAPGATDGDTTADVDIDLVPPMSTNDYDEYAADELLARQPVDEDEGMDLEAAWEPSALDENENDQYDDQGVFDDVLAREFEPAADDIDEAVAETAPTHETAPAAAPLNKAEKAEKKAATMSVQGEAEFESFADPAYIAHAAAPKTLEVKRAQVLHFNDDDSYTTSNLIFMGVVGICATVALAGAAVAGVAYYKLQKERAADMTGVSAPAVQRMKQARSAVARGDQTNAYSAQLHHYQQTKNEIIRIQQNAGQERVDTDESDGEHDEPDYSVYECPGLAPTGDIEVANPIFDDKTRKQ